MAETSTLTAAETADLLEKFISHAVQYITFSRLVWEGDLSFNRERIPVAAWLRDHGGDLASALEARGYDSSSVVRIYRKGNLVSFSPAPVWDEWDEIQVTLERMVIQLRGVEASAVDPQKSDGEDELPEDGPRAVGEFWHAGKQVSMQRIPWQLLSFVWKAPRQQADFQDILDDVWGGQGETSDIPDGRIKTAVSRVNTAMVEAGVSVSLRTEHSRVIIDAYA